MYLEITTTVGCRNNCQFCPQQLFTSTYHRSSNENLMTWPLFKNCLDKVPSSVNIGFGGLSEPFQNPLCLRMILYAHQKSHHIRIYTTLAGVTLNDISKLINRLSFKSDSGNFMYIHLPSTGNSEHILTSPLYPSVLKFLIKQNLANVTFHYHGPAPKSFVRKILHNYPIQHIPIHSRAGLNPQFIANQSQKKKGIISCPMAFDNSNILLPNGDVIVCCQDFGLQHILGNLLYNSYGSLQKSQELTRIKNGLLDDHSNILCRYCDWSINFNAKAILCNRPFSLRRLPLIFKVFYYNKLHFFYRLLKNQNSTPENPYLKW